MAVILTYISIFLTLLHFRDVKSVFIDEWMNSCFPGCVCNHLVKSVHCVSLPKVDVYQILRRIPENSQEIRIENSLLNSKLEIDLNNWPYLVTLSLRDNKISKLNLTTNFQQHDLKNLILDGNDLQDLEFLKHSRLSSLQVLNVSDNNLTALPPKSLHYLTDLSWLYLNGNQIERLPFGFFNKTARLKGLFLENNQIDFLHPSSFKSLYLLEHLHLHGNSLTTLVNGTFEELVKLSDLRLDGNPFDCNCALKWLVLDMQSKNTGRKYSLKEHTRCESPSIYSMTLLYKLNSRNLLCIEPKLQSTSGDVIVYYLHDTVLWCNFTGYPKPSIYWVTPRGQILTHRLQHRYINYQIHQQLQDMRSFKAQPTHYESKVTALRDGSLHIEQMRNYFSGQYLCVAENPAGVQSMNITVRVTTLMPYTFLSTLWVGGSAAGGFLLFGIVFGLLRWCVESLVSGRKKLKSDTKSESSVYSYNLGTPYYSPGPSSGPSPMKCTTPVSVEDDDESQVTFPNIKETLEDVRIRLRSGMEKQV